MLGSAAHASLLLAMALAYGVTWAKLVVAAAWLAMAFFEQRRGPSLGTHWTAPAIGGAWLFLSALVMCSAPVSEQAAGFGGAGMMGAALMGSGTMGAALMGSALMGAALMGCGALLRAKAIAALGAGYSDGVRPLRARLRDGVYAYFDHPGELGAFLLAVGASFAVASLHALAFTFAALLPLTLYRFFLEERFLRADVSASREGGDAFAV